MSVTLGHNQYGKAETQVVRVCRDSDAPEIVDDNVRVALSGDFADIQLTGDNANCLITDATKNTVNAFANEHCDAARQPEFCGVPVARHFVDDVRPFGLDNPNEVFHGGDRSIWLHRGHRAQRRRTVLGARRIGAKLPIVPGTSFAAVGSMLAIGAAARGGTAGLRAIFGAIVIAGAIAVPDFYDEFPSWFQTTSIPASARPRSPLCC